jgi:UDP-glucuronate 4-epimerase
MKYLVTGTAGFIGFHLAQRLIDNGDTIVGFDALTPYYDVRLKRARQNLLARSGNFTGFVGRLEEGAALEEAANFARPDIIVHLAAQAGVRYALTDPKAYIDSNIVGSWRIIELARRFAVQHLVLASTSSIYGASPSVPFVETDKADEPLSLYAATKKSMEVMAHANAHLHHVPTTAIRFFTVYGPWGRPDMALFKFTKAMLAGIPIEVYGYGHMSRDFTYIDDLIEGIVRLIPIAPILNSHAGAIDSLSPEAPFRIVNVGCGQPTELSALIEALEDALGRKATKTMLPMQPGDVTRTYASTELLTALTGYVPTTGIKRGVQAFVDWYRSCAYTEVAN